MDNSDPEHPIIRYVGKEEKGGGLEAGVISITGEYESTAISGEVIA